MKYLLVLGIVLMLIGGALMVKGFFTVQDKHEADIFGAKISVTENDRKPIPMIVSGTILAVGAIITVIGAAKAKPA
jgi:hypothetical protein